MTTMPAAQPAAAAAPHRRPARRGGFSFVEILFAVMILGIGFIMIAGVFPVAISQTAASQDDTVASQAARAATSTVAEMPYLDLIAPTNGAVQALDDRVIDLSAPPISLPVPPNPKEITPWQLIKGSQILSENPKYAWIAFVRRDTADASGKPPPFAHVTVVPVHSRGRDQFDTTDQRQFQTSANDPHRYGTLIPAQVKVELFEGGQNPDEILITEDNRKAAAPGAVVIMRGGVTAAGLPIADKSGRPVAGRAYRLGALLNDTGTAVRYELIPGNDMTPAPGPNGNPGDGDDLLEETSGTALDAYLIGLAPKNLAAHEADINQRFEGTSMVLGVYSAMIKVRGK